MDNNRTHLMSEFNDYLDEVRSGLYRLLEFSQDDWSEKKDLAKREVQNAINELRIRVENLTSREPQASRAGNTSNLISSVPRPALPR